MKNRMSYFIQGVEELINGSVCIQSQKVTDGLPWRKKYQAMGYNAVLGFLPTYRERKEYSDKVVKSVISTEQQYNRYTLNIRSSECENFILKVPYLLCQPSAMMAVLSEYGFTENKKY